MNIETELLQDCLDQLNHLPAFRAVEQSKTAVNQGDRGIDGSLTLTTSTTSAQYVYSIKRTVSGSGAGALINLLKRHQAKQNYPVLLLTRYVSNSAIDQLIQENIEFADTAGNIYLNSAAAYVLIRGKRPPASGPSAKAAFTPTGLKLTYAILQKPAILAGTIRDRAAAAGISIGSVSNILKSLVQRGYLQKQPGKAGYAIANYERLRQRWELGYAESLRTKLLLKQFAPFQAKTSIEDLQTQLIDQAELHGGLIGGELGAAIATAYLRPQSAVIHLPETANYRAIALNLKLKPSPTGNITFLQQFGNRNGWHDFQAASIAHPLLLHAELMLHPSDRLRETANRLHERFIAPTTMAGAAPC